MLRDSHCVHKPLEAGTEHRQCSARLSERLRTSTFNENSEIRLFQQEISSLYQCLSSKKAYRENDRFRYPRGLLRFRYICLNAPNVGGRERLTPKPTVRRGPPGALP